jgi:CheY-like chemotaxis protein
MTATNGSDGLLSGIRVLLVEDETLVAMLLEDMIADLGGTVVSSASRVSRALEIVQDPACSIDLAVLDVNLGGEEVFSGGLGAGGAERPIRLLHRLRQCRPAGGLAQPADAAEAVHPGPGHHGAGTYVARRSGYGAALIVAAIPSMTN